MTAIQGFLGIATWSGKEKAEFYEVYYKPQGGKLQQITLFYPEYYRSMVIRLYNFDGKAVTPQDPIAISYEEKTSPEGRVYKQITSIKIFKSYDEAAAYVSSQKAGNYRIVGTDPFVSPVPLDAVKHYGLIYSSEAKTKQPGGGTTPSIKIFEYIK